ncbi:SpoIIE family protein phosphatase [Streptomyces carpinensis]|uniref:SpoIIE family protein phosphatase n=1 Tax=Streptomyces carpinensis TaxID=66369 RepID=A0ABV1W1K5_9ACTN|nr:SpoIIE family protein phosphatase [Streptomyces carpinensis]
MGTGGTLHLKPGQLRAGPAPPGSLMDVLTVAAVVLDAEGRIVLWSPQAEQLFGYTAKEALGQYAARLLVDDQHLDLVIHLFGQVMGSGGSWAGVFPIRHKDGTTRLAEFRNMRLEDERDDLYSLGIATDEATLRTIERDLALSSRLVSQSPIGLAVLDTDLRYVAVNPALEKLNGISAEGHLGRMPREIVPMLGAEEIEAAMRQVLETGVPILDQDRVGRTPGDPDHDRAWSSSYYRLEDPSGHVLGIAISLVDTTERHQVALEAEHARRHLALVADASVRIGTTLDLYQTAQELADLTVPRLADIATVDVLDCVLEGSPAIPETQAPAVFRALALTSAERSEAVQAADQPGRIATYGPDRLVTRAVRTGRPVLLPHVGDDDLPRIARDQEAAALLAHAGVHSYLAVPLTARGEVIGALDLKRTRNPEPFDRDDAMLAGELATRAAISIDNARLYQSVRNTALTLQRSLLPEHPPALVGLEIASRYQPAGAASEVGGDWFDIIPLSHDRTALVVGDVMGNGIGAAATMGRLRTATQAFTELDLAPDQVLHYLDKITSGLEHYIATCIYAVYDPHHGQCRIANAGHLPPALVRADRFPELIDLPVGAPLGVGGIPFRTTILHLSPGDRLVFYTDGLVEIRGQDIETRLTALLANLAAATDGSLDNMCDRLLDNLRDPAGHDDVALLIARVQPDAGAGDCPTGR